MAIMIDVMSKRVFETALITKSMDKVCELSDPWRLVESRECRRGGIEVYSVDILCFLF